MDSLVSLRGEEREADGRFRFQIFDIHVEDMLITTNHGEMREYLTTQVKEYLYDDDEEDDEDEGEDNERKKREFRKTKVYTLKVFGVNQAGESVCVHVPDFEPYFYLRLPDEWQDISQDKLREKVRFLKKRMIEIMEKDFEDAMKEKGIDDAVFEDHLSGFNIVKKENFYWFDNKRKLSFLKMRFRNMQGYYNVKRLFLDKANNPVPFPIVKGKSILFKVYESNIEPMLKFLHERDLKPCGWCELSGDDYENCQEKMTTCNYEMITSYKSMKSVELNEVAPYITASFDIECDSLHGDFPLAVKGYTKHGKEIVDMYFLTKDEEREKYANMIAKRFRTIFGYKNYNDEWGVVKLKKGQHRPSERDLDKVVQRCMILLTSNMAKDETQKKVIDVLNRTFPKQEGDPIIQIGTTFRVGKEKVGGHIVTLGSCDDIPGVVVESCQTENEVIAKWIRMIRKVDPDILTGYNINGFDYDYIFHRMIELRMIKDEKSIIFPGITRVNDGNQYLKRLGSSFKNVTISSAAMGDNINKFLTTFGRINMDLLKVVRKTYMSLESYKLDSIASTFMNGSVKETMRDENGNLRCMVGSVSDLKDNEYISFTDGETWISDKYQILELNREENYFVIDYSGGEEERLKVWKKAKDDVPPNMIFQLQKGTSADRATIARYCIQDCNLVLELDSKIENIGKAMAMANVCSVPLGYIFLRGQGIKLASLVFKECSVRNILIETLPQYQIKEGEADGYEGAVVLEPKTGIYLDEPVSVLDYSSLYPSSIISENISHDSIVWIKDYELNGEFKEGSFKGKPEYRHIKKGDSDGRYNYIELDYDILGYDPEDMRKNKEKIKVGTRKCCFAQPVDQTKSTIPNILQFLLSERKKRKKLMKKEKDPFKYNLLDAEQLAYKVTANSLYGQMGAKTSKFCFIALAACTTSYGRKLLNYAKNGLERLYSAERDSRCDATYVYGDTDSVFVNFRPKGPDGKFLKGKEALKASIDLSMEAEVALSKVLKAPHYLEYEKTFMPFFLLSKKRYIGNKYEHDINKYKRINMGVVTKRRDNAPIVKVAYNTMNNVLMTEKSVPKTIEAIQQILDDLISGKYGLEYLTITKSLRAYYADPSRIAHKVLADRIGERDPGNKPKPNDRLGFVYINKTEMPGKKLLQGDKIETPDFIKKNDLQPDYKHYITNQIMKPILQVLAIVVDQIPGYDKGRGYWKQKATYMRMMEGKSNKLIDDNIQKMKEKLVQELVFDRYIRRAQNGKRGLIHAMFGKMKAKKK